MHGFESDSMNTTLWIGWFILVILFYNVSKVTEEISLLKVVVSLILHCISWFRFVSGASYENRDTGHPIEGAGEHP